MRTIPHLRAGLMCFFLASSWHWGFTQQQTAPLTLREAVEVSLEKSPDRTMAQTAVDAGREGSRLARTALLPSLTFSEAATRGNDPVYVFGTRLRQQRFQQSDFALNSLNRPLPINDFTTRFAGNWMAFDSWHTQFEIRRADLLAKSSSAAATRADQEIVHRAVEAYESILLAMRQVEVAQRDVETAKALLGSSENKVKAGLAVDADQLTAAANLSERQQNLISAQGRVEVSWAELEAAIGELIPPEARNLRPLGERHFDPLPLADELAVALKSRPDREDLALQRQAQQAAVQSARSAFGPQISTFGSWQTDRPSIAGAGGNNWLAGAELRVDILPAAKRENLALAKIALRRAEAATASADQQIRLEVTRAYYEHQAAQQMLDVARASTAQTAESLRILQNRYQAGVATMTELLRAEDAETQSSANYWQAVSRNTLTYANLKFATGTLTPGSVEDLQ
ncbi:MAG: TolC family protein [Acidobacteria bacterium]|nr:TolC family protein [Acidobacteriota bacterium]MBW4044591.1 TolC family protein [Acidobacteriota bacterium]